MIAAHKGAGRLALTFAHQLGLSVLGTVVATALLTGLAPMRSTPTEPDPTTVTTLPSLTSGGKYAARALAGDEPQPFVSLTSLPILLPLFTAPAVPPLAMEMPVTAFAANTAVSGMAGTDHPDKPVRGTLARREVGRPALSAGTAPASRDHQAGMIAMAALPQIEPDGTEAPTLLVRSRTAYREVALWRDVLLDHLLP